MGLPRTGYWARLYLALEFPPNDRKPGLPSGQSRVAGLPQVRSETRQSLRHAHGSDGIDPH